MSTENRSLVVPSLVYLGAVLLIGLPATMAAYAVIGVTVEAVGLEGLLSSPVGGVVLLGLSLLIGLQVAVEVAAVQLGGVRALGRGSRRAALTRYALFTASVFVVLLAVTWIGLSTAFAGYGAEIIVLSLLVGFAGLAVLYRSSSAFLAGLRDDET